MIWNQEKREETAIGRFEVMCEMYIKGTDETRETILSFLSDEEKEIFLKGCGLYHLFNDPTFYNSAKSALAEQLYKEFNKGE